MEFWKAYHEIEEDVSGKFTHFLSEPFVKIRPPLVAKKVNDIPGETESDGSNQ